MHFIDDQILLYLFETNISAILISTMNTTHENSTSPPPMVCFAKNTTDDNIQSTNTSTTSDMELFDVKTTNALSNSEKETLRKKKLDAIKKYSFDDVKYTPNRNSVLTVGGIKFSQINQEEKIAFLRANGIEVGREQKKANKLMGLFITGQKGAN